MISSSKLEGWKRALAIFGAVAMAPIAGLAIGIFALSAAPVILLIPFLVFRVKPHEAAAPPFLPARPVAAHA